MVRLQPAPGEELDVVDPVVTRSSELAEHLQQTDEERGPPARGAPTEDGARRLATPGVFGPLAGP